MGVLPPPGQNLTRSSNRGVTSDLCSFVQSTPNRLSLVHGPGTAVGASTAVRQGGVAIPELVLEDKPQTELQLPRLNSETRDCSHTRVTDPHGIPAPDSRCIQILDVEDICVKSRPVNDFFSNTQHPERASHITIDSAESWDASCSDEN